MAHAIKPSEDALFVEGPDDTSVINELVRRRLRQEIGDGRRLIRKPPPSGGGDVRALEEFKRFVNERKPASRVAVVVDRDGIEEKRDRLASIKELAVTHGLSQLKEAGGGFAGLSKGGRLGIWLWPDNENPGDLEHFVAGLVAPMPVWDYARVASLTAKKEHGAEYDEGERRKVELKVRSVWAGDSGGGYGHIIRKGLADRDGPAVDRFVEWFRWVFLEE
jgi:hypothetical protein